MRIYLGMNVLGKIRVGFVLQKEANLKAKKRVNGVEMRMKWR